MKVLVDMNLSPSWVGFLSANGFDAVHWSTVGNPGAEDSVLLAAAQKEGRLLFTHDMDFSALIAVAGMDGPSVLQVRTQDVLPEDIGKTVVAVLRQHAAAVEQGAIITVVESGARVRVLPILRRSKPGEPPG